MQFTAAAILALAGAAAAQVAGFDAITSPPEDTTMQAGETFEIVWQPAPSEFDDELIDIVLLAGGSPETLNVVDPPIATGLKNSVGQFDWEVPADLGDDETYGIKIMLQSDPDTFQFSFPFAIEASEDGGNSTSTSSSSSAKPTSSSTSSAYDADETTTMAKTTVATTTTEDVSAPTSSAAGGAATTTAAVGLAPQATAGAFALVGAFVVAAVGL